jgi:glucoamylase
MRQLVILRNHREEAEVPAGELIGTDFLQLVRFGLRSADDPVVRASITVADELLKVDTPVGPAWRRYTGDGYGEHDDGSAYDGTGRGRPWPLLAGERGHYEVAAGRDPLPYLQAMCGMSSPLGLIPEQIWDGPDIPARGLFFGKPSGSARPLAWAHAEFAKLVISRQLGRPVDRPSGVWRRYRGRRPVPPRAFWSPAAPIAMFPQGARLVVALPRPTRVRWSVDGGARTAETDTMETGLGFHAAELDTSDTAAGGRVQFEWTSADKGGGRVTVVAAAREADR